MRQRDHIFTPYPAWLALPDPIVEHCECCWQPGELQGQHLHDRSWTKARAIAVFEARPRYAEPA